ncbi:AAA family ATPase [Algoriphagus sanaruensis]|uniref:ATPase n=1 Tax=Algoriphagus sanaruensis TaxID=1727163 RepID=A0A142EJG6_9BACT|nr:ATP-binding protein [Algoriphagus sanaruensis]AMQ55271.1 ATPase [Algoriphagus sanaruensis]
MQKPKRILILGPESTGKSTLAEDLGKHFGEPWVPEFAREYLEKIDRPYEYEDLLKIAKGQILQEDTLVERASNYLFCDTDLRVIHVWSEHKYGKTDSWVLEEMQRRVYDLILLTDIDLPWEPDPLREHPDLEMRQYFFEKYQMLAEQSGFPWQVLSGDRKTRSNQAIQYLSDLF